MNSNSAASALDASASVLELLENGSALVWSLDAIKVLRANRISGSLVGAVPGRGQQNAEFGVPFTLLPQEVPIAAQLLRESLPPTLQRQQEEPSFRAYRYFWEAGFWLSDGFKFGCDFMAYAGNPQCFHACFLIHVHGIDEPLIPQQLSVSARMATTVKKQALWVTFDEKQQVRVLRMKWLGVT